MLTLKYPECIPIVECKEGLVYCKGVFQLKWCPEKSHHGNCSIDTNCFESNNIKKSSDDNDKAKTNEIRETSTKWWEFWRK